MTSLPEYLPDDERGEFADDAIYFPGDEVQNHVYWHPFGKSGFIKGYSEYKFHILIRFRIGDGQDFLACVQRDWEFCPVGKLDHAAHSGDSERNGLWADRGLNRYFLWRKAMRELRYAGGQEQSMLVNVVEPVEGPQRDIPSLVWLNLVENFENLLLESWYDSSKQGYVRLGRMSYGELGVSGDDWDNPTGDVIESAAKTMENIACNQRNVAGDGRNFADTIDQFARLRILFSECGDWVGVVKDASSRIELLEVLLGPVQFI